MPSESPWRFLPPYVISPTGSLGPLWARLHLNTGLTVLKTAGSYLTVTNPSQAQYDAADAIYLGGHIYDITDQEASALMAAGYGVITT